MATIYLHMIDFNPLPPHGGRLWLLVVWLPAVVFQSTPSAWRETIESVRHDMEMPFQSTPSAWRETCCFTYSRNAAKFQSTPSAWRETFTEKSFSALEEISIHSLRMEGDRISLPSTRLDAKFQSTPSAWRETFLCSVIVRLLSSFQSTPSAWRETSDANNEKAGSTFQSTPSAWRETMCPPL